MNVKIPSDDFSSSLPQLHARIEKVHPSVKEAQVKNYHGLKMHTMFVQFKIQICYCGD